MCDTGLHGFEDKVDTGVVFGLLLSGGLVTGTSSHVQTVENRLTNTYGHTQEGRALRNTGDSILSVVSALAWTPSGIPVQYVLSLLVRRQQVRKNNNPGHGSVLNVFPATTSEPSTPVLSALGP